MANVSRPLSVLLFLPLLLAQRVPVEPGGALPGTRVVLDAHNAYPYDGRWEDRIDRALATGLPVAIEQDLVWYRDPETGEGRSVISHGEFVTGREPTMADYVFERIRPIVERALAEDDRQAWPIVVLNLDFKTNEPEHHAAVWDLLGRYEAWLTTAERLTDPAATARLDVGPVMVLTGEADEQERSFHERVRPGARLRLFGAIHASAPGVPDARTNYRRWWNNPWSVVEAGGQARAGDWTPADDERLRTLVARAHAAELWIRFYTLNGHDPADESGGWSAGYNFGSLAAVQRRWQAAVGAGVDFIAVDQYEAFAAFRRNGRPHAAERTFTGVVTHADYERLLEQPFDVPPNADRVEVDLAYDDGQRTVLDLGLRGPSGFRGWSGGGAQRIFVSAHSASFGYSAGAVEPGRWTVILGVPNIRPGVTATYTVTIRLSGAPAWPTLREEPAWYAGDLHAHSGHSDGRTVGADGARLRVPPEHVFDAAKRAGLDFVALTDHNTGSHWADVDRLQPLYPGLLLLHGREITTYRGHLNAFGESRFIDFRLGEERGMRQLASELAVAGAFLSVNHPERPDDESCMGCGWNDRDSGTMAVIGGVEIVNGEAVEGGMAGWPFWAAMLNRGHRLTSIGGSDEHTPDDTADGRLGTPTTVIYAQALSESSLLEGLRAGRAYVRTRGPDGPALEFWAEAGGNRYTMGGVAPPGRITLRAMVRHAPGGRLEWIRNGRVLATERLTGEGAGHELDARAGDWFSLIVRDERGPAAFSNAIYVRAGAQRSSPRAGATVGRTR